MPGRSSPKPDIRTQACVYLGRREHARSELLIKLLRKGYRREDIDELLNKLESEKVLSHTRFVEDYIESRERKGYGPNRIKMELLHKGIDKDEVEGGLKSLDIDWLTSAQRCYERKYKGNKIENMQDRSKRKNYLFQRGYPGEIIQDIVE